MIPLKQYSVTFKTDLPDLGIALYLPNRGIFATRKHSCTVGKISNEWIVQGFGDMSG